MKGFKDGMKEAEGGDSQKIGDAASKQTIDAEAREKNKS